MFREPLSRRNFIGKAMLATAGINLISSLKISSWQTGCFTRPWAQYDYREAFDGIAAAGFANAGLMSSKTGPVITKDTKPEQTVKIYEEASSRGLKIACVHGGNFDVSKSVEEGINGLKSLIDSTAICKCKDLLLLGIDKPELVDSYYKVVGECCDYAAERGVIISVKPHGPLNNTGLECRPLIEKIGHKNFRLWYDPGNIYYYSDGKINPVDDASEVDGLVTGMSIKDFRMPKDVEITPGTGMVNFQELMKRLRKGGFKHGALLVECLSKGDLKFINSEAAKAFSFMEKLMH